VQLAVNRQKCFYKEGDCEMQFLTERFALFRSVAVWAIAAFIFLGIGFSTQAKAQCASQMAQNMQQMAQKAIQCGESASLLSSIQNGGTGQISASALAQSCQRHVDVSSQLSAFNECSRVYICATLAYAYALSNLSNYGGNCTAAANAGLQQYPVQ
jgi:hypothetical protein